MTTTEQIAKVRATHAFSMVHTIENGTAVYVRGTETCELCQHSWPCDAIILADALETALTVPERLAEAGEELLDAMSEWNDVFRSRMDCALSLRKPRAKLRAAIESIDANRTEKAEGIV